MRRISGINADMAGFFTSLLCAIHCSAVPVLISFGVLGAGTWLHNHMIDWTVIALGFLFAGYSLVGDFWRRHKNPVPLLLAFAGFGMLLLGMIDHHGWMLCFSVAGGLFVATSHVVNFRLSRVACARL